MVHKILLQTRVDEKSLVSVISVPVSHSSKSTVAPSHLIHGPVLIFLQEGEVTQQVEEDFEKKCKYRRNEYHIVPLLSYAYQLSFYYKKAITKQQFSATRRCHY